MSDSVRPYRRQPTRLRRPWDSPGKNTGVGCRFLHQCMKVKRESEAAQSCLTLSDPKDCSLPGSSVHRIFQVILKHVWESSCLEHLLHFCCWVAQLCPTLWTPIDCRLLCPSLSSRVCSISCPLHRWCYLIISSSAIPFPFAFNLSQHQGLSQGIDSASGGQSIGASPSASVLPRTSGLISLRTDWFDIPTVQGTLKGLLQHHSSKVPILRLSAFFMLQLSHLYMTTGKIIALTRCIFVGKVMSLLFNTLSRFVIAFLPRNSSVQFSHSVVSDSLQPHESQNARPPYPSPTPGVHSDSCPLSQ